MKRALLACLAGMALAGCGEKVPDVEVHGIERLMQDGGGSFSYWRRDGDYLVPGGVNAMDDIKIYTDVPQGERMWLRGTDYDWNYARYRHLAIHIHGAPDIQGGETLGKYPVHIQPVE